MKLLSRNMQPSVLHMEAPALSTATPLPEASTDYRKPIVVGMTIIGLCFGVFGLWAATAPLSSAVVGHGTVIVETKTKDVQHLEGGIIAEMLVRDGDRVKAGDVVVRLDPVRANAQLQIVRSQLEANRALEARLIAERDGRDKVTFPPELLARSGEPQIKDILDNQLLQFSTRKAALDGQVAILRQRVNQYREQIKGLEAQRTAKRNQINILEDELKGLRELLEKGYTSRTRILAMEREVERLSGDIGEHSGELARTLQAIGEAELQILQQQKTFREEVAEQLRRVQTEVNDLKEREIASFDQLNRLEVRAPVAGFVNGLAVHTVGGVVQPGRTLLQIVPSDEQLIVETQVQVTDAHKVLVGTAADIRFTALNQRTTPILEGTVQVVSPDRLVDERSGIPYFKVLVAVNQGELVKLGDQRLTPGMPADVMVKTGDRTMLQYLLNPLTTVISKSMRES